MFDSSICSTYSFGSQSLHFVGHALLLEAPQLHFGQLGDGEADSGSEVLPRAPIHAARERPGHAHLVTGGIQLLGVRRDIRMSPKPCPVAEPGARLESVLIAPEPRWPRSSTWRSASPPRTPAMFARSGRCRPATSRSSRRRHGSCHCVTTKQTRSSSTLRSWPTLRHWPGSLRPPLGSAEAPPRAQGPRHCWSRAGSALATRPGLVCSSMRSKAPSRMRLAVAAGNTRSPRSERVSRSCHAPGALLRSMLDWVHVTAHPRGSCSLG